MSRDKIIRGLISGSTVNITAISAETMVETARKTHGLSRVCTAALGRVLMMTAMMSCTLKAEQEMITSIIKGGGPAGSIVCTGKLGGVVKGYIDNPTVELPPTPSGKLDVSMAVGWFGELTVIKDLMLKEPYIGKCKLVSGEIAEDFAEYFAISEQQPSLVYLGVRVNPRSGLVLSAGGLLIQALPECPGNVIDELQRRSVEIQNLGKMLETTALDEALKTLFNDMGLQLKDEFEPEFRCDCSRERLERVMISLGRGELTDMIKTDHGAEGTCHFCNTKYKFAEADLEKLLFESQNKVDAKMNTVE